MISVWFWNKYAVRPLHLLGGMGLLSIGIGVLFGFWSVLLAFQEKDLSSTLQPFMSLFFITLGFLFFVIGLVADMLTKIYYGMKIDSPYFVKDIFENRGDA